MTSSIERPGISAGDLIQLPRFDTKGAIDLGERLLDAAGPSSRLPRPIGKALEALAEALADLRGAAAARLAQAPNSELVLEADRALDTCWTALYDWLTGFAKLPDGVFEAEESRALLRDLYPDGLSFILLPYELEWSQSDERLRRLSATPLEARIHRLGGRAFIEALGQSHEVYGRLLGLPKRSEVEVTPAQSLQEALEGFTAALRVYALKVTAHVEVDDPRTGDLSHALLEPLLTWRSPRTSVDGDLSQH